MNVKAIFVVMETEIKAVFCHQQKQEKSNPSMSRGSYKVNLNFVSAQSPSKQIICTSAFPISKSQELRSIVCNIVTINHCIRTQQIHITLGFQRGRRSRLFATFLSTFSRRAATGSSASTSTLARFPYLTRFMTGRLWKQDTICKENVKVNKPQGSH